MFGDREWVQTLFDNVPDTLSELIRTALVPKPGHKFVVADFSAIEARVLSWYAGERWRMNVFAGHGKIYEASAEQMFNLRPGSVKKGDPMRQRGKTAELGLGYSGSAAALVRMGALKNGLKEEELPGLVSAWRAANPAIVACWNELDKAAMDAVRYQARVPVRHGVVWLYENKILHMILPSGRALRYVRPRIVDGKYDEVIEYSGMDTGKWGRKQSWRGIWIENLCQALARDCLRDAMLAVEQRYPDIVLHVHDELVVEVPEREASVALLDICEIMGRPVPWAPGLLLRGDGFVTDFYRKD